MAKLITHLHADFDEALDAIHQGILSGSVSASYEDGADFQEGLNRTAVRVYERYSWWGGNRVSLNLTLMSNGTYLTLVAITSGGSQAVFFKLNTLGENAFLDCLKQLLEQIK